MKKTLIALAALAAVGAASAQSSVTIYGTMGVSFDSVDGGTVAAGERRGRVSSNNSNIGFKGTEDLGGGLAAIWQLEYAVQMDQQQFTQAGQTASPTQGGNSLRNTFVGLSSKALGALTLGTQESPLKTSTGPLAVFGDTLGDYRSVFTKLSTRSDNSILYTSPNIGGFVVRALHGMRNEAGAVVTDNSRMYALSGVYASGPLYATLAYENNKDVAATTSTTTYTTTPATTCASMPGPFPATPSCTTTATTTATTTTATAITNKKNSAWRAGVGYTFGNTKLGLAYEKNDVEGPTGLTTNDADAWYVSVAHQMGNIGLKGAYTKRSDTLSTTNDSADQITVGADYSFSKRTSVYALYTRVSNDGTGTTGIGGSVGVATVPTVAGGDAKGFSLGLIHKF